VGGRYAARLNAFRIGSDAYWPGRTRIAALDLAARAATAEGIDAVDVNYPDHLTDASPAALRAGLDGLGLALNGFAMRYYGDARFRRGAFVSADKAVRRAAIDLTKRGIDALREAGGDLMTLWLGQDGWDAPFGADYARLWDEMTGALAEVAAHDPAVDIAVEYKPDEPRSRALLADVGTTLLAVAEAGAPNLGVALDFAHVLYAGESPAMAAATVARRSRLLGVHLNDGYGGRDDGLMVGAVSTVQTLELLVELERVGYDGALYFDTFPDLVGLDPVAEATANVRVTEALRRIARGLAADPALSAARAAQDAVAAHRIVQRALLGA
jgi:xylose isomerase